MDNQYFENFNSEKLLLDHLVVADGNIRTFGHSENEGNFTGMIYKFVLYFNCAALCIS